MYMIRRGLAFIVDYILFIILFVLIRDGFELSFSFIEETLSVTLFSLIYFSIIPVFWSRTIGKAIFKLKITMLDGSKLTLLGAVLRNFIFWSTVLSGLFYLILPSVLKFITQSTIGLEFFVVIILTVSTFMHVYHRGFHDRLANTLVKSNWL
jgi:uncharacterized RDD family membrane protein YckC